MGERRQLLASAALKGYRRHQLRSKITDPLFDRVCQLDLLPLHCLTHCSAVSSEWRAAVQMHMPLLTSLDFSGIPQWSQSRVTVPDVLRSLSWASGTRLRSVDLRGLQLDDASRKAIQDAIQASSAVVLFSERPRAPSNDPYYYGCGPLIGSWRSREASIGARFLQGAAASEGDVQALLRAAGITSYRMYTSCKQVLDESSRRRLIQFADTNHHQGVSDSKCTLQRAELEMLIGGENVNRLQGMVKRFGGRVNTFKLRRVEAADGRWINFHTDNLSPCTMQIPLNDESEYDGGRLVFATKQGLMTPSRNAGSATIHDDSILHGVTAHTRGVRYSLFLLHMEKERPPQLFGADAQNVRAHWHLLAALVGSEAKFPSVFSDQDWAWWLSQIDIYRAWLFGVAVHLKDCNAQARTCQLPAPPHLIRYCWISHMLQPSRYLADCLQLFGDVLRHDNADPFTREASAEFKDWWRQKVGYPYPLYKDKVNLTVDWRCGIDSAENLYHGLREVWKDRAMPVSSTLLDYRRYLLASQVTRDQAPAPTLSVDLCWHAHMCNPVYYNMQMLRGQWIDHKPAGSASGSRGSYSYTNADRNDQRALGERVLV